MRLIGSIILLVLTVGSAFGQTVRPVTIRIDGSKTYQTIEGWGGSVYPQTLRYSFDDPTYEKRLLEDLNTTHIRMRSVWYLLEAENDNDDAAVIDFAAIARGDTGLVHDEFLLQQRLSRAGVTLQFASWRFPYWMIGESPAWNPSSDEKPALPESMDAEYIESIAAYILYAREEYGFTFDAVSVANEPDIGIYISELSPARLLKLSRMLDERLRESGYATRFYLPDVAAADSIGMAYTKEFLSLDGAAGFTSALAYHSYRREDEVIRFFGYEAERHGLPVWVTEQSHTHLPVDDRFEWSHALANAVCLYDVLAKGNASLTLYWSLAMASSSGLGLYVSEQQKWAPAYDMLKHFYNDVPVGSVRVDAMAGGGDDIMALAFRRPDGEQISVILINAGDEVLNADVLLARGRARVIQATVSQTLDTRVDRVTTMPIAVPPRSVSTFVVIDDR